MSLRLWLTHATPTPTLPHSVHIPAGPVLHSLNTVNNYLSAPELSAPPLPPPMSRPSSLLSISSDALRLISPLPFSDSDFNRMLILTGGFQSRASSFLSRRAPQVHQHKVALLFIKEVIFPFSGFSLFSFLSHVRKKTRESGKRSVSR